MFSFGKGSAAGSGGAFPPPAASAYVGPLDLVPGATCAYGVRALSAAWLGQPLFRLRKGLAGAEQTFSADAVTGNAPTASIATFLAADTGYLMTFFDQSGSGADLTAFSAIQWEYIANAINGKCGFFDAGGAFTSAIEITSTAGKQSFLSVCTGEVSFGIEEQGASNNYAICNIGFSTITIEAWDDVSAGTGATFTNNEEVMADPHVWDGGSERGTHNVNRDGVALAQASDLDAGGAMPNVTETIYLKGVTGFFPLKFGEAVFYGSYKTPAARLSGVQNQATYYGITLP